MDGTSSMPNPIVALFMNSERDVQMEALKWFVRHFWTAQDRPAPRLRVIESLPIAGLLAASVALVLHAETGLAYTRAAAESLHAPKLYIDAVMGARPVLRSAGAAP